MYKKMEEELNYEVCKSNFCRFCCEKNYNGYDLYEPSENGQILSDLVNTYLPLKVSSDDKLPTKICPGCNIQLEATIQFFDLIVDGQARLHEMLQRENQLMAASQDACFYVMKDGNMYSIDHNMSLKMLGIKPKRKRGRPPKKHKTPEEIAKLEKTNEEEETNIELRDNINENVEEEGLPRKRKIKTPFRFKEVVQGKELDRIFREEGVTDGEESEVEPMIDVAPIQKPDPVEKVEVIGVTEGINGQLSGELVTITKGKGRGRPKGKLRSIKQECIICGLIFTGVGRYMSHVAQHGPVLYQCLPCQETFSTRLHFMQHQADTQHTGKNIIHCAKGRKGVKKSKEDKTNGMTVQTDKIISNAEGISKADNNGDNLANLPLGNENPSDTNSSPSNVSVSDELNKASDTSIIPEAHSSEINTHQSNGQAASMPDLQESELNESVSELQQSLSELQQSMPDLNQSMPDLQSSLKMMTGQSLDSSFEINMDSTNVFNASDFLNTPLNSDTANEASRPEVENKTDAPTAEVVQDTRINIEDIVELKTSEEEVVLGKNGKARLKCPLCDKTFSNKQNKSVHIRATHAGERPYECKECGAKFPYSRSLALHYITHKKTSSAHGYACDLCGKVLSHPSSVAYHKEAEHASQRYVCIKCGKGFKHKQLLQRHQLVHSQFRPYACRHCDATFKTKTNLMNHYSLHSGIKKFSCEICSQQFSHKTSLTLHMRWHTGQKPYACDVCGKMFTQKGNLCEHMRIHSGEKPFKCAECPRAFTTSSQHKLHARRHTGERPFSCKCGKRFLCRESWRLHMRREAGNKEFKCDVCGRGFCERWALVKHTRCHTGERPHACPHCPKAFADSSNLNKHKKQIHKDLSKNSSKARLAEGGALELSPETVVINGQQEDDDKNTEIMIVVPEGEAYEIVNSDEVELDDGKILRTCNIYEGESLLVGGEQVQLSSIEDGSALAADRIYLHDDIDTTLLEHQQISVPDENEYELALVDGTRFKITTLQDCETVSIIPEEGGQTINLRALKQSEVDEGEETEEVDGTRVQFYSLDEPALTQYWTIV